MAASLRDSNIAKLEDQVFDVLRAVAMCRGVAGSAALPCVGGLLSPRVSGL